MSQADIPNITPNITLSRDDAVNLLLASIALEELGLSHVINSEAEKIQYTIGTLPGLRGPVSISDILSINQCVRDTLNTVMKKTEYKQIDMEALMISLQPGHTYKISDAYVGMWCYPISIKLIF
ncbi:hypothetical protein QCI42_00950 [Bacillus fungorum]|uniref:hypothetical protein n=1 Tax=Bacillus fungorum TaxID=2039284 RepID=UPI0033948C0B